MRYMSVNMKRLRVCLPAFVSVFLCVRTTLQSGCLFLAGGCKLINFDRLPLRPTTNTSSRESRHFHLKSVFFGCFLCGFLSNSNKIATLWLQPPNCLKTDFSLFHRFKKKTKAHQIPAWWISKLFVFLMPTGAEQEWGSFACLRGVKTDNRSSRQHLMWRQAHLRSQSVSLCTKEREIKGLSLGSLAFNAPST